MAARLWATFFGAGYSPAAPGTAGSLAAWLLALVIVEAFEWRGWHFAVLAAALVPAGVWASGVVEKQSGRQDPGVIVIDEVLGQWVTLAGVTAWNWKSWLAALLLFRLFDIWKPFPVSRCERLPGGVGIVADDLAAGAYGALVLYAAGCFNLY